MTRFISAFATAAVAAALSVVIAGAASAQAPSPVPALRGPAPAPQCVEGRLASGACANPSLALGARDRAIIFGQPRLSMTAVVRTLPSGSIANDRLFRSPNNPITDSDRELDLLLRRVGP